MSGVKGYVGIGKTPPGWRTLVSGAGVSVLLAAVVPTGAALAAPAGGSCPAAVPVQDIVAGQEATGLTVSVGATPESFTATVLGRIADGIAPGIDMVIADLDGAALRAAGGVWSGMSGSPVYAEDGRLVGAVSYGLSAGPSLVAGITPAASMRELLDGAAPAALAPAAPVDVPTGIQTALVSRGAATAAAAKQGFRRLEVPLGVTGGLNGAHRDELAKRLDVPQARVYTAGQAASGTGGGGSDIVAGGNFAAALAYGDLTVVGVGTTTVVCDGEALAFGHPMLFSGPSSMSVHGAEAVFIQEDKTSAPFKVANPGPPVGTVDRDRIAGLHATLGSAPDAIPITAEATLAGAARTGTTQVNMPAQLPGLSLGAVLTNTDRLYDRIAGGRSSVAFTVTGTRAGGERWTLDRSDIVADEFDLAFASAVGVADAVAALQANRFEEVEVTGVEVETDLDAVYRDYTVERVTARVGSAPFTPLTAEAPLILEAGTVLDLRVEFTPYKGRGAVRSVELSLDIPSAAAGGSRALELIGGPSGGGSVAEPVPGEVPPVITEPDSFDELLAQLENAPHNDDVRATLSLFGPGPAVPVDPAPGDPAPGDPAPGDPAPGDPAPGDPAPGNPPAPSAPSAPVSVQDSQRVGDAVRGGLFIPVTVQ